MFEQNIAKPLVNYGSESLGKLKRVMLHRPEEAIKLVTADNKDYFLFNQLPDVDKYLEEHKNYEDMLKRLGVEVHILSNHVSRNTDLLNRLPNLAYIHDLAVVSAYGSIISKMATKGRCHEELVVKEALENLGIPTLYEFPEGEVFESCLLFSPTTVFVADTERHSPRSIEKFIGFILQYFDEVIYAVVPQAKRFIHADMIINRVTENLMIYYSRAFLKTYHITKDSRKEIEIKKFMAERHIDMLDLSDEEQQNFGCSFVSLASDAIINYDISLNQKTINLLEREGVKIHPFHPDALLAGGGSLRCLTLKIWRESDESPHK